ncbi:hypothetical protein BGZ60DRAFT_534049 [Tricladium varicosporioides]|nr:hypothetical protein BGZ60DRAFT_534049 [Hymenoscyphus varicosporioides]
MASSRGREAEGLATDRHPFTIMKREYTEEDVMRALEAITSGASTSWASKNYGVPRSTLQERLKGRQSYQEAASYLQKLSLVQEQGLTDWVLV